MWSPRRRWAPVANGVAGGASITVDGTRARSGARPRPGEARQTLTRRGTAHSRARSRRTPARESSSTVLETRRGTSWGCFGGFSWRGRPPPTIRRQPGPGDGWQCIQRSAGRRALVVVAGERARGASGPGRGRVVTGRYHVEVRDRRGVTRSANGAVFPRVRLGHGRARRWEELIRPLGVVPCPRGVLVVISHVRSSVVFGRRRGGESSSEVAGRQPMPARTYPLVARRSDRPR